MANPTNSDLSPNGDVQGTSYIYKQGTTPNTRTVVSQKVRVLAPAYGGGQMLYQVGVMNNFAPTQDRSVDPVGSIGFGDVIAELVPGLTGAMTASVERTLLYLSNLWQSTGYAGGVSGPVRSLRHHRWPFDIMQQIVFSTIADRELTGDGTQASTDFGSYGSLPYTGVLDKNGEGTGSHNILITMYEACWWSSWNATFNKDTAIVAEGGNLTISDVHDGSNFVKEFTATGGDPSIGQLGSMRFNPTFSPGK